MNRIVREHYPVSRLPEDLRRQLQHQKSVTVTVAWNDVGSEGPRPIKTLEELFADAAPTFGSLAEVASHVRSMRDD